MRITVSPLPATRDHRVATGIVYETEVPSSRGDRPPHRVRLMSDGTWDCECEGFRYASRADGLCRHVDEAKERRERLFSFAALFT